MVSLESIELLYPYGVKLEKKFKRMAFTPRFSTALGSAPLFDPAWPYGRSVFLMLLDPGLGLAHT